MNQIIHDAFEAFVLMIAVLSGLGVGAGACIFIVSGVIDYVDRRR